MLFFTQRFLLFYFVVFALYWALPWKRARVWLLVAASYYFYMSWNAWLAALITFSAIADYLLGRFIEASISSRRRKFFLVSSILWNLGQLAYFKYANFFLDSLRDVLSAAGAAVSFPALKIILPIGISFYTFEAISYTVDVYRRRIPAERSLINFVLFITFFPRLIAGPIIRGRQFLPQVRRDKRWDWARLQIGANYFVLGLIKKLAIADRLATFSDPVFANPTIYSSNATWVAVVAYTIQIYCDFSGYTDMAIGLGHGLGYKLPQNFNMPFLARNISEFWSRWHISLTSWLRDYLFVPLGGNRGPRWRTFRNIFITMVLCGLWHGAKWTFVAFGAVHAICLVGHRILRLWQKSPTVTNWLAAAMLRPLWIGITFLTFALSLVLFRSANFTIAGNVFSHLVRFSPGIALPHSLSIFWWLISAVAITHLMAVTNLWNEMWCRIPALGRGFISAVGLSLALLLAPDTGRAFIYFQF